MPWQKPGNDYMAGHLGIDLGTTFSLAAFLNDRNVPELIPDARYHEEFITPSVIHVEGNHVLVGHTAERVLHARPNLPVTRHAKLAMGTDDVLFEDRKGQSWLPQSISSAILKKLRHDATVRLGHEPDSATIAVPANFTSRQRLATRIAGLQAGFETVDLIDEPVAAAAAYGLQNPGSDQTIFVFDLGGGTFDATVIHNASDGIHVLSTAGSKQIGGKFFDEAIAQDLETHYQEVTGKQQLSPATKETFRKFAIEAKCNLSMAKQYRLHKDLLLDQEVHSMLYTYHHLSRVLYPMLQKTIDLSEQCIKEAGLEWSQIDKVLLTGGSSQLPAVTEKLMQASGLSTESFSIFQPSDAIAFGAALVGNSDKNESYQLKQQISAYELGILTVNPETGMKAVEVLMPRNCSLPFSCKRRFYYLSDKEDFLDVFLVQRREESDDSEQNLHFRVLRNQNSDSSVEFTILCNRDGLVEIRNEMNQQIGAFNVGDSDAVQLKGDQLTNIKMDII